MKYFFLSLLFFLSLFAHAQNMEGVYESVIPDRLKEVITLSANNKYEEVEYRWREGQWKLKCTYKGVWSIAADTIKTTPGEVVWHDGNVTACRPQDDSQQPGCCYSRKFNYDNKSIWLQGVISKTKYVYNRKK